jgi:tryptophanyl-tRNA synthetase
MSKSKGNTIGILETPEAVWAKLAPAKTDPARIKRSDPGIPEKCNLYSYHTLVTPTAERDEVARQCRSAGIGCLDCKKTLHKNLMAVLDPIRTRYAELSSARKAEVSDRLEANAEHCRKIAAETILEVKGKMGLSKVWKI